MASIQLQGDNSGSLTIQAPSDAGNHTLTLPATSSTLATQNALGVRNLIINGDMRIDQRNAGASVTPSSFSSTFITDRFFYFANNSNTNLSFQQQSSTPPSDFSFYTRVTANSAGTVASTNEFSYIHRIEGQNMAHLKWGTSDAKTVTLSFWVRSSLTGTFGGIIGNNGLSRIYPFSYTISSANTWEKKTITIAGDTTGTWLTTNGIGMQIYWSMGCGATFLGTAGSWGSTFYLGVTGQTNLVQTNGATYDITGVQLEVGDTATPFEHRPYDMELARCYRYYQQLNFAGDIGVNGMGLVATKFSATDAVLANAQLLAPTRVTATITKSSSSARFVSSGGIQYLSSVGAGTFGVNGPIWIYGTNNSIGAGANGWIDVIGTIYINAEL